MAYRRLSISLPVEVEEAVRREAALAGMSVSAWLVRTAEHEARLADGRRAMREVEAEIGAFTEQERHDARQVLEQLGVLPTEAVVGSDREPVAVGHPPADEPAHRAVA